MEITRLLPPQTRTATGAPRLSEVLVRAAFGFVIALPFALSLALGHNISHDEHQHIAAGALLAREGLWPYRDFAYFHVPYLVWAYGLLFHFTDQLVLATRLFSAACAALTAAVVFAISCFISMERRGYSRWLIGLGAAAALLFSPVFCSAAGHSWNQEPSTVFVVLAFAGFLCAPRGVYAGKYAFAMGVFVGIATGFRVTMLPMALPLAVIAWLTPSDRPDRFRALAWYSVGLLVAMLPLVICYASAPEGFVFGNIEFPKVNIAYRLGTGEPRTMTVAKKLRFLFKLVMRPNWLPAYGFIAALTLVWARGRPRVNMSPALMFTLLSMPFLLLGALAPSPLFEQYFYPLPPFLIMGAIAALGLLPQSAAPTRMAWGAAAVALVIFGAIGIAKYRRAAALLHHENWVSNEIHGQAMKLRESVGANRKVLTLSPTLPLEGGLRIYPELATGPFGFRVAPFVPAHRHQSLHVLGPGNLAKFLAHDQPDAILTGNEPNLEKDFEDYAVAHGFHREGFGGRYNLWLPQRP